MVKTSTCLHCQNPYKGVKRFCPSCGKSLPEPVLVVKEDESHWGHHPPSVPENDSRLPLKEKNFGVSVSEYEGDSFPWDPRLPKGLAIEIPRKVKIKVGLTIAVFLIFILLLPLAASHYFEGARQEVIAKGWVPCLLRVGNDLVKHYQEPKEIFFDGRPVKLKFLQKESSIDYTGNVFAFFSNQNKSYRIPFTCRVAKEGVDTMTPAWVVTGVSFGSPVEIKDTLEKLRKTRQTSPDK